MAPLPRYTRVARRARSAASWTAAAYPTNPLPFPPSLFHSAVARLGPFISLLFSSFLFRYRDNRASSSAGWTGKKRLSRKNGKKGLGQISFFPDGIEQRSPREVVGNERLGKTPDKVEGRKRTKRGKDDVAKTRNAVFEHKNGSGGTLERENRKKEKRMKR